MRSSLLKSTGMSTVFVAAVLVGLAAVLFTVKENKRKRSRRKRFLTRFSELGSLNNLTFSGQEILKDVAIGLDGVRRKLLVITKDNETVFNPRLLDLRDVKSCSVKKRYGTVEAAGFRRREREHHLEKIALRFEFKDRRQPAEVPFYHHVTGGPYEVKEMNAKARRWCVLLSKMLRNPLKEQC